MEHDNTADYLMYPTHILGHPLPSSRPTEMQERHLKPCLAIHLYRGSTILNVAEIIQPHSAMQKKKHSRYSRKL